MNKSTSRIELVELSKLRPYTNNARKHSPEQIEKIRASLREFGFVNPCLIDADNLIIAGHGRVEAAKAEGLDAVPCVRVEYLTDTQVRAYILADNKLAEMATWDMDMLAYEVNALNLDGFDIEITGFSLDVLAEDEAIDLNGGESNAGAKGTPCHCPKCGFVFEV